MPHEIREYVMEAAVTLYVTGGIFSGVLLRRTIILSYSRQAWRDVRWHVIPRVIFWFIPCKLWYWRDYHWTCKCDEYAVVEKEIEKHDHQHV